MNLRPLGDRVVIKKVEINNISGLKYLTHRDLINDINTRQDFDYGVLMVNFKDVEKFVSKNAKSEADQRFQPNN